MMKKNKKSWFIQGSLEKGDFQNNLGEFFCNIKDKIIREIGMNKTLAKKLPTEKDFINYLLIGEMDYFANYDYQDLEFGKQLITHFILNRAEIGSVGKKIKLGVNSNYIKLLEGSRKILLKKIAPFDRTNYAYEKLLNDAAKYHDSHKKASKTEALRNSFDPRKHQITQEDFDLKFKSIYETFRIM